MADGKKTATEATAAKPGKSILDQMRDSTDSQGLALVKDLDFDALIAQLDAEGGMLDASQLGEGFHLLKKDDKKKLVGVPFIIVRWKINPGRFGGFATLHIKTAAPIFFNNTGYSNFIINDGGSGINQQIQDLKANGFTGMIRCLRGLQVSEDYEVMEEFTNEHGEKEKKPVVDPATGKPVLGTTYYLDTSL